MSIGRFVVTLGAVSALAACAPQRPQPPQPQPQPTTAPAPTPARVSPPPPPPVDWTLAPLSPGGWSYRTEPGGASSAAFGPAGQPSFTVRCDPSRQITLARTGPSSANALAIRTSSGVRAFPAQPGTSVTARLTASDRFLDAMVFSRGRFTVEVAGLPLLIIPAWPEAARVVEDCRS